jgi:hypothetical protein
MLRYTIPCWLLLAVLPYSALVRGDVIPIGPFPGAFSESFDHLNALEAQQQLTIMGGFATVRNLTPGGALKWESSSSLDGVLVTPHSPPKMLGQLGISEWDFNAPLSRFGSYFANNSRFDDAQVHLYDADGGLIDSVTATIPISSRGWTWNGWESTVPIQSIVVVGNDTEFLNGFIWFDDAQATPVPEPFSLMLLGLSGLIGALIYCSNSCRPQASG